MEPGYTWLPFIYVCVTSVLGLKLWLVHSVGERAARTTSKIRKEGEGGEYHSKAIKKSRVKSSQAAGHLKREKAGLSVHDKVTLTGK